MGVLDVNRFRLAMCLQCMGLRFPAAPSVSIVAFETPIHPSLSFPAISKSVVTSTKRRRILSAVS